jgi:hypothetical protein
MTAHQAILAHLDPDRQPGILVYFDLGRHHRGATPMTITLLVVALLVAASLGARVAPVARRRT